MENVYDLLDTNNGIQRFNAGKLEKTFELSLCKDEFIKCVKIRNSDGKVCILRYAYYIGNCNQKRNDVFEKHIEKYYEKI